MKKEDFIISHIENYIKLYESLKEACLIELNKEIYSNVKLYIKGKIDSYDLIIDDLKQLLKLLV